MDVNGARDPSGDLLFATGGGISRFDGEKFVNFGVEDGLVAQLDFLLVAGIAQAAGAYDAARVWREVGGWASTASRAILVGAASLRCGRRAT